MKQMNKMLKKFLSGGIFLLLMMSMTALAAKAAPDVTARRETSGFDTFQILKISNADDYVSGINAIIVNGERKESVEYETSLYYNKEKYYINKSKNEIYFYDGALKSEDTITISHPDYDDLIIKVTVADSSTFEVSTETSNISPDPDDKKKETPGFTAERKSSGLYDFQSISLTGEYALDYMEKITEIAVNGTQWREVSAQSALFGSGLYFKNKSDNSIYFDGTSNGQLNIGDILTFTAEGYKDLVLKITAADSSVFSAEPYNSLEPDPEPGPTVGDITLHVRLIGAFESALKGQQKYDAVTGASTSVSANKNSNVTVQAALLPNGQEPVESDWKSLPESGVSVDPRKTTVNLDTASGMAGVYSPYDGSLTLAGIPNAVGKYAVSVTVTDTSGRTVTSNALTFQVYDAEDVLLIDQLKTEYAKPTADGKYMYDMEPWAIKNFGGENETVAVPADIKAWYGSHTSGTYGELGYAVSGEPEQTLIVPAGCNLTLVNMKILSSVKIVVEDGGRLVLQDSSMHGKIVINKGGSFSMNYNDREGEFLTGASINGQLILNDGAVLENASIYSNTNSLANGTQARQNVEPVVLVNGNVTVRGKVYIRGDEAPTGTDASTLKSYSGQPALKVQNGTLNIGKDSSVAAYGGGKDATTSVGGSAVILENGTITGEGKLIALGGNGFFDEGGSAVIGTGTLSAAEIYLEGGSAIKPKDTMIQAGLALKGSITLAGSTNRNLIDGVRITDASSAPNTDRYWSDITTVMDLGLYPVSANAPEKNPGNGSGNTTPDGSDKTPEGSGDQNSSPNNNSQTNSNQNSNHQENSGQNNSGQNSGNFESNSSGSSTSSSGTPSTGDSSNPALYLILLLAGAAAAVSGYCKCGRK